MRNPEHPRPYHIEIRIDGIVRHSFLAERFTTNESTELLTLEAARWQMAAIRCWPNPFENEDERIRAEIADRGASLRLSNDAGEFLNAPAMRIATEFPNACPVCRRTGGEHDRGCLTQFEIHNTPEDND